MTHEPECEWPLVCHECAHDLYNCICPQLRAAYQRGRQDGAKMKGWLCLSCYTHWLPTVDKCLLCEDGEQA